MREAGTISGSHDEINGWAISKDRRSATWGEDLMEIVPETMPARLGGAPLPRGTPNLRGRYGKLYKPEYVEYIMKINGVQVMRGTAHRVEETAWRLFRDEVFADRLKGKRPSPRRESGGKTSMPTSLAAVAMMGMLTGMNEIMRPAPNPKDYAPEVPEEYADQYPKTPIEPAGDDEIPF